MLSFVEAGTEQSVDLGDGDYVGDVVGRIERRGAKAGKRLLVGRTK